MFSIPNVNRSLFDASWMWTCRWCCAGEAEFWSQLHSCDCWLSSEEWEVSCRYGSGQVDSSPLVSGGLSCRRTLHRGMCLHLWLVSFSDKRWCCSYPLCLLGGAVRVGQQLYTGRSAIHQLSAEETGTGSHAMEENTTRQLKQGGTHIYVLLGWACKYMVQHLMLLTCRARLAAGLWCWILTRPEKLDSDGCCSPG